MTDHEMIATYTPAIDPNTQLGSVDWVCNTHSTHGVFPFAGSITPRREETTNAASRHCEEQTNG